MASVYVSLQMLPQLIGLAFLLKCIQRKFQMALDLLKVSHLYLHLSKGGLTLVYS